MPGQNTQFKNSAQNMFNSGVSSSNLSNVGSARGFDTSALTGRIPSKHQKQMSSFGSRVGADPLSYGSPSGLSAAARGGSMIDMHMRTGLGGANNYQVGSGLGSAHNLQVGSGFESANNFQMGSGLGSAHNLQVGSNNLYD